MLRYKRTFKNMYLMKTYLDAVKNKAFNGNENIKFSMLVISESYI